MSHFIARKLGILIGLGFALLMTAVLLLALLGGLDIHHTYQKISASLDENYQIHSTAHQLQVEIGQLRRHEKNIFLRMDHHAEAQESRQRWNQALQQSYRLLQELEKSAAFSASLKRSKDSLKSYQFGVEQVFLHINQLHINTPQEADQALFFYKEFIYDLDESLSVLNSSINQHENELNAQMDELRQTLYLHLAVLLAATLLICGVIAFFVTRRGIKVGEELAYQAEHDVVTHLLNPRGFEREVSEHAQGTLISLELDHFKLVNDLCGHAASEELLAELALRLLKNTPSNTIRARVDGAIFTLFFPQFGEQDSLSIAQKILESWQKTPFTWQGRVFSLNASIGLVESTAKLDCRELVSRADSACTIAKERGNGQIVSYREIDQRHEQLQAQMSWASKLPPMLKEDRFVLFYQKMEVLQLELGYPEHAEILVRGIDEYGKIVPPGLFLPAAERFGLINQIDQWVAKNALSQRFPSNTVVGINLSAPTLSNPDLLPMLENWVKNSPNPAATICFEVTESAAMTDIDSAKHFIARLKSLGCKFALDDFGSGFSSFSYLKELHVDYLKIDGSLIRNLEHSDSDIVFVAAIIQMAKALKLRVIAEFVENNAQKEILRTLGIDYAQGYAVHKPSLFPTQGS